MPGMFSSIAEARVGISQAPRSCERRQAKAASRTRRAIAFSSGVAAAASVPVSASGCELTIRFIEPWRYSMTSRDRCRATGTKPMVCSSDPSAWGCELAYSMNSMPSTPRGLLGSGFGSRIVMGLSTPDGVMAPELIACRASWSISIDRECLVNLARATNKPARCRLTPAFQGPTMETPVRLWSQHLANLARAAFWLLLAVVVLLQLTGSRGGVDRQRAAALGQFERERNSRAIAMIHRQEGASLLGVPVTGSISID